ncbi:MAG: hypothetical protein MI746_09605, partial [Pseudomonadales bacterium]|nr:hypothetical protein [Pseudomonadales bacterium]
EIRQKLVQLHERLLGKTYASNSEEINAAYQLFVDSRQERISASGGDWGFLFTEEEYCEYYRDEGFFEGTAIENTAMLTIEEDGEVYQELDYELVEEFLTPHLEDPHHTKQAWVTVITYLMTHYHYLYE